MIALASILATIVSIDGLLFQRASKVITKLSSGTTAVTLSLSPNVSMVDHFTGLFSATLEPSTIDMLSESFLPIAQDFASGNQIALTYTGCTGKCTAENLGPGLEVERNTTTSPFNLPSPADTFSVGSTLRGLILTASRKWSGNAKLELNNRPYREFSSDEETSLTYLPIVPDFDGVNDFAWLDPRDIIISGLQELLCRAAIAASKPTSSATVIANEETHKLSIHHITNIWLCRWLLVYTIISTSVNLRGWRHLGEHSHLGLLELPKLSMHLSSQTKFIYILRKTPSKIFRGRTLDMEN